MMNAVQLLGLNTYEEARGEITDGKAAIARVVKNRMMRRFFSDGTVAGTILKKDQFSWAWFDFVTRVTGNAAVDKLAKPQYRRIAATPDDARFIAESKLLTASPRLLAACTAISAEVMAETYRGAAYDKLTDWAVSYLNPRILTRLPKWATPDKLVCRIGNHDFYRE